MYSCSAPEGLNELRGCSRKSLGSPEVKGVNFYFWRCEACSSKRPYGSGVPRQRRNKKRTTGQGPVASCRPSVVLSLSGEVFLCSDCTFNFRCAWKLANFTVRGTSHCPRM